MTSRLRVHTSKRIARTVGIVALVLILVLGISSGIVHAFAIQRVEVDGQGLTIELDKKKLGGNLLVVPTGRLTKELLDAYPLLSSVSFEKRFPGTLIIHLVRRQPFVLIRTQGAWYALGAEGVVLDTAQMTGPYPRLSYEIGPLVIGSRVADARVLSTLEFLSALPDTIRISVVNQKDSSSIRAVMGDTNIFLPHTGDMKAKADTLQTIVEGFRIKGTLPSVIDLRFDKPIITN